MHKYRQTVFRALRQEFKSRCASSEHAHQLLQHDICDLLLVFLMLPCTPCGHAHCQLYMTFFLEIGCSLVSVPRY
jgi:hypothetical protein